MLVGDGIIYQAFSSLQGHIFTAAIFFPSNTRKEEGDKLTEPSDNFVLTKADARVPLLGPQMHKVLEVPVGFNPSAVEFQETMGAAQSLGLAGIVAAHYFAIGPNG